MRLATGNILLCAGVLAFAVLWENWSKPDVIRRIIDAAKPDAAAHGGSRYAANDAPQKRMDALPPWEPSR